MKNVTITLDADTAARAKVQAAERNMSLSRFIGEVLRDKMRGDDDYERARRYWLSRKPTLLRGPGERYATREELYDRAALRRDDAARRKRNP